LRGASNAVSAGGVPIHYELHRAVAALLEQFGWGLCSTSSFRFRGSATSGRLGTVTVLPQLKVDRLCSVVDGTTEFDPNRTCGGPPIRSACRLAWVADD
jgi:hypothetical protein